MRSLEAWTGRVQLAQELAALLIVVLLAAVVRRYMLGGGTNKTRARSERKPEPAMPAPEPERAPSAPAESRERAPATPPPPVATEKPAVEAQEPTDDYPAPPTPKQMDDLMKMLEKTITTVNQGGSIQASPARPGAPRSNVAPPSRPLTRGSLKTHTAQQLDHKPSLGPRRNSADLRSEASLRSSTTTASVRETLRRRPKDPFQDAVLRATVRARALAHACPARWRRD